MIVDAGHNFHLGAVGQIEAAHDVHLPELHGLGPLPPLVVRSGSLAGGGLEEVVTDQGPIDRRPARQRCDSFPSQVGADGPRSPPRMGAPHLDDPGFDHRSHLVRAGLGLRALVDQPGDP